MKPTTPSRARAPLLALLAMIGVSLALSSCSAEEPEKAAVGERPKSLDVAPVMETGFEVDPRRQQLIGVTYATVERRRIDQLIRTVGTVEYDESRLTDVSLKFGGWIEKLLVDKTGTLVHRGQVLLELYSPELVTTQQEYLTAFDHSRRLADSGNPDATRAAQQLLEATALRLAYWDISETHVRDLETKRKILRALPIHSPSTGYVIDKRVVAGTHTSAGQLLYRLADLDEVWVLADIYEYELPQISLGQPARVSLAYLPGATFEGRVTYVYPYLETAERTVKIRIQLANPGHRLKQGMYADVMLAAARSQVLVVPRAAVLDSGARQVVFVALDEGRFEPRPVVLGAQFDDYYEIVGGLEVGERIVASGNFLLDSESQLASGMGQMEH